MNSELFLYADSERAYRTARVRRDIAERRRLRDLKKYAARKLT